MKRNQKYDFGGWATRNDLKCSDGRIIRRGAFEVQDGAQVPLVWNHQRSGVDSVLGHAILENRDEGVYAYCSFNNTQQGKDAKEAVCHGDVTALSIWANNLVQEGKDVLHGVIREVSLVLAGANPGAYIESVLAHGEPMDDFDDEGILFTGDSLELEHSSKQHKREDDNMEKTFAEIYETLTEEQKELIIALLAAQDDAADDKDDKDDKEGDDTNMKHNIFSDGDNNGSNYLSHADTVQIFNDARRIGSLKEAVAQYIEDGELVHAIPTKGMTTATGSQAYGFNDASMLFPDHKVIGQPEFISRNQDWVQKVMSSVHRTPFSRVKSIYANITEDEARAKGYIKGKQKKDEVFTTLKRATSPQTIYKKQKLDRDDIIDITDLDVVMWIKQEMRMMLDEEIARSILIGDGRMSSADDKINEQCIRPVAKDDGLFNTTTKVKIAADATPADMAKTLIDEIIRSRKDYKGSGNPTFWTTESVLTEMLLLEDKVGHKLYKTVEELATALRVKEIVTVEPMEGQQIEIESKKFPLLGTIVNLVDYNVGADKGGEINMFEDFDIDFNQNKYLIETRASGALIKPFSALTFVEEKATHSPAQK